jgi:NAD(P)-dependent dehydrogenase (short-subunit alcohol dehydrogenase family)
MSLPQQSLIDATPRFNLTNRVAVVTGGSSGIGLATAELLAACGATVVILSRNENRGRTAAAALASKDTDVYPFVCDVTNEESVAHVFQAIQEQLGSPTVLINSAGLLERGTAQDTSLETWNAVMSVNATAIFLTSKQATPLMRNQGGGVIVNVSSEAGLVGIRNLAAYCAAKAAVVMLTRCMALDLADDGIRVNCVCPGTTLTPMVEQAVAKHADPAAELERYATVRPLKRLATPAEIASAVVFLASDECGFATGAVLAVDGGYTA